MELLVVLLGEIIFAPFMAALVALAELLITGAALVVELALNLVLGLRRRRERAAPAEAPGKAAPRAPAAPRRAKPVWVRRLRWTLLGLAGATILISLIVGTFFVSPVVGWMAGRIEARTGIAMDYTSVGGNLFFGELQFEGLKLRRGRHELSSFDLKIARCELEMDLMSALNPTVSLRHAALRGVRGTYERHTKPTDLAARRLFSIEELQIEDLEVRFLDHTVKHGVLDVPVVVTRGHSRPMRSQYVLFDALFRSDYAGSIAARPVRIETEETPDGRWTRWRGEGLPLELASHWIAGPFSWIRSGKLDVKVDDEWKRGDTIMIDSHWRLVLTEIEAAVPGGLGIVKGGAAKLAVALLNRRQKPLAIEFDFTFDEQSFRGVSALAQTEFVEKVATAVRKTLTKMLGK